MSEIQPQATPARPQVAGARRIVVKVGTRVLSHADGGLALSRLFEVVEVLGALARQGREVLLVTSGAVGLGRDALGLAHSPTELSERQACAAIGQSRLMELYQAGFSRMKLLCAQILLTQADFYDRARYLNLRATLLRLLELGVIPIINENDVVSTDELAMVAGPSRLVFGDNDKLSALIASKVGTELLVLLTDVPGVFDRDPRLGDGATLIRQVDDLEGLAAEFGGSTSGAGRGGMRSKVEAASVAARSGCHAVIACGLEPGTLARVLAGEEVGTLFPARGALSARRRWIAFASAPAGVLHVDAGAQQALVERGASLLAAGVTGVEGRFERGDIVELRGPDGTLLGRGIAETDAAGALAWTRGVSPAGVRNHDALVRREHLVLEESVAGRVVTGGVA